MSVTDLALATDRDIEPAAGGHGFSRSDVELLKRTVAAETNDDELALFLATAHRRGLDPFNGQIHCVMRWDGRAGRKVMKIQTGIDGYRMIADRTGLVEWAKGPSWSADGKTWTTPGDAWVSEDYPAAARFSVKRRDRTEPETRVVTWREYVQTDSNGSTTRMWSSLAATMLGKCAEAATLRAAFPEKLGGIYTVDEMDQAHTPDGDTPVQQTVEVDHPEERRDLFRRFQSYYRELDADGRAAVWAEIEPRLYNGSSLGDRFASTPLHVLEDIVESCEADTGGTDQEPADEPADAGPRDDDVVDAEIVDEPAPDGAGEGDGEASSPAPSGELPEHDGTAWGRVRAALIRDRLSMAAFRIWLSTEGHESWDDADPATQLDIADRLVTGDLTDEIAHHMRGDTVPEPEDPARYDDGSESTGGLARVEELLAKLPDADGDEWRTRAARSPKQARAVIVTLAGMVKAAEEERG